MRAYVEGVEVKIIIDIEEDDSGLIILPEAALDRVKAVISDGRVSACGKDDIPIYCPLTVWPDNLAVMTRDKKTKQSADSFRVYMKQRNRTRLL